MVEIGTLPPSRWSEYRDIRLEALREEPSAFAGSYEEESPLPRESWEAGMANALFATSDGMTVGVMTYRFLEEKKLLHIATICGVYVRAGHRGRGIGKRLLDRTLQEIRKNRKIVKINLHVNPLQEAAVKLYEQAGFTTVGRLRKDLFVDGEFYDELVMEKFL